MGDGCTRQLNPYHNKKSIDTSQKITNQNIGVHAYYFKVRRESKEFVLGRETSGSGEHGKEWCRKLRVFAINLFGLFGFLNNVHITFLKN